LTTNKRIINSLIVEDHSVTAEAYGNIISANNNFTVNVKIALNCDEAIKRLQRSAKDLVLLDLQLPASKDKKFISGEDIGLWLRNNYPKTKIIIFTSISDSERIRSILKKINPEGFLIKSDIVSMDILAASQDVLYGNTYYSKSVKNFKNNNLNGHIIDYIDRKILYHLSMGETNSAIANIVCISKRTVEARKAKLKDMFDIFKDSDNNLIKEAKRRNYI